MKSPTKKTTAQTPLRHYVKPTREELLQLKADWEGPKRNLFPTGNLKFSRTS